MVDEDAGGRQLQSVLARILPARAILEGDAAMDEVRGWMGV